jgi:hypothetical protein
MLVEEMGTIRKKSTATQDKNDFNQGLRCLAHLIAQAYLRKEMEKLTGEKTAQEGNNGAR